MTTRDTQLLLGDFEFSDFDMPEYIEFGGEQAMHVHKLIGGARIIDAMGPDDTAIRWSGRFQSQFASQNANQLDQMRRDGLPLTLSWRDNSFSVIIKSVVIKWERYYQCLYQIECEVIQDLAKQDAASDNTTLSDSMSNEVSNQAFSVQSITGAITSPVQIAVSSVQTAVQTVHSFEQAALGEVQGVLGVVNDAKQTVQNARSAVETIIHGDYSNGLAGLASGVNALTAIDSLNGSVLAATNLVSLNQLDTSLGLMSSNLKSTTT